MPELRPRRLPKEPVFSPSERLASLRNYKSVAGPPNIFINPPVAQLRELSISDTNMANQKSKASKAPTTFASSRETNTDHLHDETLSHNRMAKRKFKTAPSDDDSDSEPIIRIPQRKRLCQKSPASAATHDNITSLDGANDISDSAVAVSTRESKKKQGRSLIITLPAELIDMIYVHIDGHQELVNLARTCKLLRSHLTPNLWYLRFKSRFDLKLLDSDENNVTKDAMASNESRRYTSSFNFKLIDEVAANKDTNDEVSKKFLNDIFQEYRLRTHLPQVFTRFMSSSLSNSKRSHVLMTLHKLITESDAALKVTADGRQMVSGRNLDWLRNYVSLNIVNGQRVGTDLLEHVNEKISRSSRSNPFVASFSGKAAREAIKINEIEAIIKLCLTHLMLDPAVKIRPFAFPLIQSAVYQTRQGAPLVKVNNHGVAINLMWLQHTVHFFKWHLKGQQGDGELTEAYNALSPGERPRGWPSRLEGGTKSLAGRWKGTFSYIAETEDLDLVRADSELRAGAEDAFSEERNGFQDLKIFANTGGHPEMKFKDVYDDICEFKSKPEGKDLEGVECLEFFGLADAEVSYHLVGRIHSLPDQEGIPGWQKVSMVKFMPDQEDGHHGPGKTVAWAYEGVVLPGNQIMVGRWYEPSNDYCGPFIFWRTSSQEGDEKLETENEEAVNFLQTIEENLGYVSYV